MCNLANIQDPPWFLKVNVHLCERGKEFMSLIYLQFDFH